MSEADAALESKDASSNAKLQVRRERAVARGVGNATAIYPVKAQNAEMWDADGSRFLDFAAGIAVLNTGHRHPKVMSAVHHQLALYTHTAFQVLPYEPYVELAERLNSIAPFSGPAKTLLLTTGAEAVENAIKIARSASGRRGVIAFTGGFHGRTMLTMGLTGKVAPYKRGFGPGLAEIYHLPFPNSRTGIAVADTLRALDLLFYADISPADVAAIIIEPVQGEGGFNPAPVDLMVALRRICDEHGIFLIVDEVQTGFARTGKMFGIENYPVEPDLVTVAKALGGGFPLSGVIGRAEIMDAVEPGGLGGTYSGSPVACAAALAVLDVIAEERLTERANVIGTALREAIASFADRNDMPSVSEPRGPGAMIAFDLIKSRSGGEPDGAMTKAVLAEALKRGLILLSCGRYGETIRILVPLTISDAMLAEGLKILAEALKAQSNPGIEVH